MLKNVLHKHAPLKSRIIRGNPAPLMNKELSKAVMRSSQLEIKYNRTKQEADRNTYKKQRNLCVKLKQYFSIWDNEQQKLPENIKAVYFQ